MKCILCGGNTVCTFVGMNGYVEGTKYDVYECSNCLSSSVYPISDLRLKEEYDTIYGADNAEKTGYYSYYYYLAHGVKKLKNPLTDMVNYSAIFWGVGKALGDNGIKKGQSILEVGSGLGYFTYALNKAGYICNGLDYSLEAVQFAKEFFGGNYVQGTIEEFSKKNKNTYDAIIAMEVIEHVVDPNIFIEECLEVLKPGGKLIITTPIKDIHPRGTIWETNPAPIHLWWFTEKGIESIAKRLNVKISFVDFTDYTTSKIWKIHTGVANVPPNQGPVLRKDRSLVCAKKKGYKEMVMGMIPAWLYIKIVCVYHDLKFLQRNKTPSRYMYGMCAVLSKP